MTDVTETEVERVDTPVAENDEPVSETDEEAEEVDEDEDDEGDAEVEASEINSPKDIKRKFFMGDEIVTGKAQEYINVVQSVCDKFNIPYRSTLPTNSDEFDIETQGIAVITVKQKKGDKRVLHNVVFAAMPNPHSFTSTQAGQEFLVSMLKRLCMNKVSAAAKPSKLGKLCDASKLPIKLADFITSKKKADPGLKTFNEIAPAFVQYLKEMDIKYVTVAQLRAVLSSTQTAQAMYPRIGQDVWVKMLNAMVHKANSSGKDSGMLENWLETRDETTQTGNFEVELDELDFESVAVSG